MPEFRRIVVNGVPYRWRFDEVLAVIPGDCSGPQLYVDWGWRDWLEPDGPVGKPLVVTPRFVAEAIRFATAQGWPCYGWSAGSFGLREWQLHGSRKKRR